MMTLLLPVLAQGCSRSDPSSDFVGRWKSSRSETPIHIFANGEWEIRRGENEVLQYGVWRYNGGRLIWTFKEGAEYRDDINPVVAVERNRFELREMDGSLTTFVRLGEFR